MVWRTWNIPCCKFTLHTFVWNAVCHNYWYSGGDFIKIYVVYLEHVPLGWYPLPWASGLPMCSNYANWHWIATRAPLGVSTSQCVPVASQCTRGFSGRPVCLFVVKVIKCRNSIHSELSWRTLALWSSVLDQCASTFSTARHNSHSTQSYTSFPTPAIPNLQTVVFQNASQCRESKLLIQGTTHTPCGHSYESTDLDRKPGGNSLFSWVNTCTHARGFPTITIIPMVPFDHSRPHRSNGLICFSSALVCGHIREEST